MNLHFSSFLCSRKAPPQREAFGDALHLFIIREDVCSLCITCSRLCKHLLLFDPTETKLQQMDAHTKILSFYCFQFVHPELCYFIRYS